MNNIKELPRIDRYSCKFENPILEKEFSFFRLKKISKMLTFSYFFFSVIMLVDIYDLYARIESYHPTMFINIFISIAMFILGCSKQDFKIRHYSNIFIIVFVIYSTYQAYLFGILLPQNISSNPSTSGDIIFMPFLLILMLVVIPFNFLKSLLFAVWAMIVNMPIIIRYSITSIC